MYEIISIVTNLTALTVIGIIYIAYIKNLRSVNQLKEAQLQIAEQNVKLWKDKVIELERRTPEFIEKQLSERIKIREDEISSLTKDTKNYNQLVDLKNREIISLKESLEKTHQYRDSITVWDCEKSDYIEVASSDLEQRYIGSFFVDSASFMICDRMYTVMNDGDVDPLDNMYRVINTGELFCLGEGEGDKNPLTSEVLGFEEELTADQMLSMGLIEKVEYEGALPAIDVSYINSPLCRSEYRDIRRLSFVDGRLGAGIEISLGADGTYPVFIEYYKNEMQRIIIDV